MRDMHNTQSATLCKMHTKNSGVGYLSLVCRILVDTIVLHVNQHTSCSYTALTALTV
jgi:hypothetical protein